MINQILVGSLSNPAATYTGDDIHNIAGHFSSAIIGDTLSIDTLELEVGLARAEGGYLYSSDNYQLTTRNNEPLTVEGGEVPAEQTLQDGTPLYWLHRGVLKGKFYVQGYKRVGMKRYQVTAYSAIGLLEKTKHVGGIYTGEPVGDVLSEIIVGIFPYSLSSDVSAQRVYGWLPYDSGRNNLHKILLALGINVTKNAAGDVYFEFVSGGTAVTVPQDRVFLEGGSVNRESVASRIDVTEHTFAALDAAETVTVFDNTDASGAADHKLVIFSDAPVHSLAASAGITIHESNANYAILSGVGTVTAKKYAHLTQIMSAENPDAPIENVKGVSSNTLINPFNSYNVLQRLYDYYTRSDTIGADIKITTELPNQLLSLTDAFREQRTAWLKSMDFRATTFIRASAQLVADYTPGHTGNLYTAVARIAGTGTWTVPQGVERIRLVLIGGGSGGSGGYDGTDGYGGEETWGGDLKWLDTGSTRGYYYNPAKTEAGKGGAPGTPGTPGKVYAADINVTAGSTISIVGGAGGAGGARNGGVGSPGGATTAVFGAQTYSSANGIEPVSGVPDLISGEIYGQQGLPGLAGGNGGITTATDGGIGVDGGDGLPGSGTGIWSGGAGGAGAVDDARPQYIGDLVASGGGGGGAAYGHNGTPGEDGQAYTECAYDYRMFGGSGGSGATADAPETPNFGSAGGAGHGGGGGGNGGGGRSYTDTWSADCYALAGYPGSGGHGSDGGDGGTGIALIYYKEV